MTRVPRLRPRMLAAFSLVALEPFAAIVTDTDGRLVCAAMTRRQGSESA